MLVEFRKEAGIDTAKPKPKTPVKEETPASK
jgi:hypothetical protein